MDIQNGVRSGFTLKYLDRFCMEFTSCECYRNAEHLPQFKKKIKRVFVGEISFFVFGREDWSGLEGWREERGEEVRVKGLAFG